MNKNSNQGDTNEFPKNIYEFESARQLEDWMQDVAIDAYNENIGKAVQRIVNMVERNKDESLSVAREVSNYISTTSGGWFSTNDIYNYLHINEYKDKKNVVTCLIREMETGVIQRHPTRNGLYRRVMMELETMDWKDAPTTTLPIKWVFGLEDYVEIFPGNVCVISGEPNAGKSAYAFNFIKLNMDNFNIHYFNSEMGESELRIRLSKFKDVDKWKFTAYERSSNFADIIRPDDVNVIDFLEVLENFWEVGKWISEIHKKLVGGMALIFIQKSPPKRSFKTGKLYDDGLGRGGSFGTEKPRLYLAIGQGRMKIVKAKNWKGTKNPNGLCHDFKLIQGADFLSISDWYKEYNETKN